MLQLEITETIVAADPVRVIEIMNRLGELGISLSLDDFGTGSSSLAYLRELPVQELKIDKSFILGIDEDAEAATIVQTIVELAHNLGLRAVGEGIETEEAYRLLAASGCDFGQGFLMGRPMPAAELSALALAGPRPLSPGLTVIRKTASDDQEARERRRSCPPLHLAPDSPPTARSAPSASSFSAIAASFLSVGTKYEPCRPPMISAIRNVPPTQGSSIGSRVQRLVDAGGDQDQQRRRGQLAVDVQAQVVHERHVARVELERERVTDRERERRAETHHRGADVKPEREVVEREHAADPTAGPRPFRAALRGRRWCVRRRTIRPRRRSPR